MMLTLLGFAPTKRCVSDCGNGLVRSRRRSVNRAYVGPGANIVASTMWVPPLRLQHLDAHTGDPYLRPTL